MLRATLFTVVSLFFSLPLYAESLQCFAGVQPDVNKNAFISEKQPQDFKVSEAQVVQYGQTYLVRKYKVEIENFLVEGTFFVDSGVAPELSITDRATGAVARVKEQEKVRLTLAGPRDGELVYIFAACTIN